MNVPLSKTLLRACNFCKRNRCHRSISSLCSFFIVWKSSVLKSLTRMLTPSFMKFFLILDYFCINFYSYWWMTFITNSFKTSIPSSLDRNILKCWHFILWRHICHHIRKYYPFFIYNTKLIRFICRMFFFSWYKII